MSARPPIAKPLPRLDAQLLSWQCSFLLLLQLSSDLSSGLTLFPPPQGRGRFLPAEPKAPLRLTLAAHPVAAGRDDRPRGQVIADCRYRQH
jgi:hypothetical protein